MGKDGNSRLASALSGSAAGAFVSTCIQPLDVVRTRMQGDAVKGLLRGPIATAKLVHGEAGLRGLWQGTGPTVLRLSIGAGIHFFLIDSMKAFATKVNGGSENSALQNVAIGGGSRALTTMLLCPVTVIKTRMEYSRGLYSSTLNAAMTIGRKEGIRGMFSGLAPTILTSAPFSAFHYMFYRELQSVFQNPERPTAGVNFFCGTLAAMGATVLTHPADVVRTRTQLGLGAKGRWASLATFKSICTTQGARGFSIGLAPRMMKRSLQTALIWTIYEELAPKMTSVMQKYQAA
ncbi:hypothetical protein BSKO_03992 [Bryopsis sp. KO-2023]|nr:hypothetical protein BSKO_03992 [Bryopsis sp. KO-2023]